MCYSSSVVTAEGAGGEGRKVPIALGFASPWGQRGAGASRGDGSSWDEPGDISKWSRGLRRGGGTHLCQHLSQLREAAQAVFGRINPDLGPSDFLK